MEINAEPVDHTNEDEIKRFCDQDSKRILLQTVTSEVDLFSKYISKNVAKKIAWIQIILGIIICTIQVVTMSLVLGRYSYYDKVARFGGGLWSSFVTFGAAILILWNFNDPKYWKFYSSFIMHLFSMTTSIYILIYEIGLGGTIWSLQIKIEDEFNIGTNTDRPYTIAQEPCFTSMLIISLILNLFIATGSLVQFVSSFVMTLMIGKAIYYGQLKPIEASGTNKVSGDGDRQNTKIYRVRMVHSENDLFPNFFNENVVAKVSWMQIILAIIICGMQIVTMSLVLGRHYYYDRLASIGGGLWSSLITISAAVLTIQSLKTKITWKLHLSFVMHIISLITSIIILVYEFDGNINELKNQIGYIIFGDVHGNIIEASASTVIVILILNSIMATLTLIQLASSCFVMLASGNLIFCDQIQVRRNFFEMEVDITENENNEDGIIK